MGFEMRHVQIFLALEFLVCHMGQPNIGKKSFKNRKIGLKLFRERRKLKFKVNSRNSIKMFREG
jgi:hypothetical protein